MCYSLANTGKLQYNERFWSTKPVLYATSLPDWTWWYREYKNRLVYRRFVCIENNLYTGWVAVDIVVLLCKISWIFSDHRLQLTYGVAILDDANAYPFLAPFRLTLCFCAMAMITASASQTPSAALTLFLSRWLAPWPSKQCCALNQCVG